MQFHVRVCRECGEEYRPEIILCADCGGELEDVYEDEGAPSPGRAAAAEPELIDLSDHRVLFQTHRAPDLVPLAERLREAKIAFHLVEKGVGEAAAARFSLMVPEIDARAALETLADLVAPHAEADSVQALETSYESGRYVRCPACGAEQGSGLAECAECGLTLGPAVPTCPRCESPVEEEGAPCPVCGGPSPTG
jgi:DNA-directed RNA polymerase subunit RPC12/RpoP